MILEEAHGDFNNAADILISMCPPSSTTQKGFFSLNHKY